MRLEQFKERAKNIMGSSRDNTKKLIKNAIVLSIDSIREDICNTRDDKENLNRSQAILNLAQAFAIVREGGKDD